MSTEWWEEVGGGGAVAAVQLAKLAGSVRLLHRPGRRRARPPRPRAAGGARRDRATRRRGAGAQRRGFVYLDGDGERTITILGERIVPHGDDDLPWERLDGRRRRLLHRRRRRRAAPGAPRRSSSSPPRAPTTRCAPRAIKLDALVRSAKDPGEQQAEEQLDPPPRLVVSTAGKEGGRVGGARPQAQPPGRPPSCPAPSGDCLRRRRLVRRRADVRARAPDMEHRRRRCTLAARAGAHKIDRPRGLRRPAHARLNSEHRRALDLAGAQAVERRLGLRRARTPARSSGPGRAAPARGTRGRRRG